MTSVYTSEDSVRITKQTAAIQRCIELTEARIRYAREEYREVLTNGEELNRDLFEHYIFPMVNPSPELRAETLSHMHELTHRDQADHLHDLKHLKILLGMLQELLNGRSDGLNIVLQLMVNCKTSDNTSKMLEAQLQYELDLAKNGYQTALRANNNRKSAPAVIAAQGKIDNVKAFANMQRKLHEKACDTPFYTEILGLLRREVLNPLERDLKSYLQFFDEVSADMRIDLSINKAFEDLVTANKSSIDKAVEKINTRHQAAAKKFPEQADSFTINAREFLRTAGINEPSIAYTTREEMIARYREQYSLKTKLEELDLTDDESVKADLEYLAEQAKIVEEKRQAALRAQQAEEQRLAAEAAELARVQEQSAIAAKEAEAEAKREQKRNLELTRIRRKQEREAAKAEKDLRKMQRHQVEVAQTRQLTTDANSAITSSKFIVPEEQILANATLLAKELVILMDTKRKKYRYSKIESVVEALGGKLIESTASSHKCIYFADTLYQEFEDWEGEDEPAEAKGSIAKPHGKGKDNAFVYRHNLRLVRNAIESVLPENWDVLLELRAQVKPVVQLARPS